MVLHPGYNECCISGNTSHVYIENTIVPALAICVLIAYTSSKGSVEFTHPHSLAIAFAACTHTKKTHLEKESSK